MFTVQLKIGKTIKGVLTTKTLREQLGISFVSLAPAAEKIEQVLKAAIKQNFITQGASSGEPWQLLAQSTKRDRVRRGFKPGPPLVRTGALRRAAMNIQFNRSALSQRLTFTVNSPIAAFQNNGTRRIPARPFFRFSTNDVGKIRNAVKKTLVRVKA